MHVCVGTRVKLSREPRSSEMGLYTIWDIAHTRGEMQGEMGWLLGRKKYAEWIKGSSTAVHEGKMESGLLED